MVEMGGSIVLGVETRFFTSRFNMIDSYSKGSLEALPIKKNCSPEARKCNYA